MLNTINWLCSSCSTQGGSLGKGTSASGNSDLDLFLFLGDYSSVNDLKKDLPTILNQVKGYVHSHAQWAEELMLRRVTKLSVQFYLRIPDLDEVHEVEVFPAVHLMETCKRFLHALGNRSRSVVERPIMVQ